MRIFLSLGLLLISSFAQAGSLRVMNFNVMCDFCKSSEAEGSLKARLPAIADTILRHQPDLISLQELRNAHQVKRLLMLLGKDYGASFTGNEWINYADEVILYRVQRFKALQTGGRWLGPQAHFNFGWKTGIPRRFEFADFEDLQTHQVLRFAGSHFDNAHLNKQESAKVISDFLAESQAPVIFAADTNLTPSDEAYSVLTRSLRNSFDETSAVLFHSSDDSHTPSLQTPPRGACFYGMTEGFPACRIDHVLLSKNFRLKVSAWSLDLFQYAGGFASDHRAVIVEFE